MKQIKFFFTAVLLLLTGCSPTGEDAIGIIGGADGPTAIFIATQMLKPWEIALYALLLAALIAGVILLIRRRKRK